MGGFVCCAIRPTKPMTCTFADADRASCEPWATCVTVDLEAGYSGRDLAGVRTIAQRRRELYVVLPVSEVIADRARDVQFGWRPVVTTRPLA